jgi:hypothetical protein
MDPDRHLTRPPAPPEPRVDRGLTVARDGRVEVGSPVPEVAGRLSPRGRAGRTASWLLLLETAVLALSLPVQLVFVLAQVWGIDEGALRHRSPA